METLTRYENVVCQRYYLRYSRFPNWWRMRRFRSSLERKGQFINSRQGFRDWDTFYKATAKILRSIQG